DALRNEYKLISQVPEASSYGLSPSQRRLWVIDQLEDSNRTAYNICGSYEFEGVVDMKSLERSFDAMIDRHESLRTIFVLEDGEPRQLVLSRSELGYSMVYEDLSSDTLYTEDKLSALINSESARSFDLSRGPLVRTHLYRLSEFRYVFLLTVHHIISDGWSMAVFIREILAIYNSYSRGLPVNLPVLPIQYKDYAGWQNRLAQEGELDSHRSYWHSRLSGELPVLDFPQDYRRPETRQNNGAVQELILGQDIKQLLQAKS
ncbi:condensation domain-containing protein, partial [Mucilaginibacter sp. RCC_168]|uniref:condensation domain-containing protein n=1 Tax=Mucilaginibacter sp. RCC_168 TaxID=3239221 RepID=UPI003524E90A